MTEIRYIDDPAKRRLVPETISTDRPPTLYLDIPANRITCKSEHGNRNLNRTSDRMTCQWDKISTVD